VDSQRGHILLVDDVPENRETLRRRLEKRGFTCDEAESGEACLAAIAANSYDLVLLDVKMPGISGLDTLESIRQQYDALALPVIMVTAHGANDDVATALSSGANDYISKPINFPVALARILSLLERRAATERLRQSEERLALVLRGTNDGIWDWNLETGEIVLSERWYELCGLEPQAAATGAETWLDRVHPDERRRGSTASTLMISPSCVRPLPSTWMASACGWSPSTACATATTPIAGCCCAASPPVTPTAAPVAWPARRPTSPTGN
jgi:CheY-like chemotaxis protein